MPLRLIGFGGGIIGSINFDVIRLGSGIALHYYRRCICLRAGINVTGEIEDIVIGIKIWSIKKSWRGGAGDGMAQWIKRPFYRSDRNSADLRRCSAYGILAIPDDGGLFSRDKTTAAGISDHITYSHIAGLRHRKGGGSAGNNDGGSSGFEISGSGLSDGIENWSGSLIRANVPWIDRGISGVAVNVSGER